MVTYEDVSEVVRAAIRDEQSSDPRIDHVDATEPITLSPTLE